MRVYPIPGGGGGGEGGGAKRRRTTPRTRTGGEEEEPGQEQEPGTRTPMNKLKHTVRWALLQALSKHGSSVLFALRLPRQRVLQ